MKMMGRAKAEAFINHVFRRWQLVILAAVVDLQTAQTPD